MTLVISNAVEIFLDVCLPIVIMIGVGWLFDRKFAIDLNSLVKINIYLFVPSFIFVRVIESSLSGHEGIRIVFFTLTIISSMALLSFLLARLLRETAAYRTALQLSTMFYNSGNWGLPLIALAFPAGGPPVQVFVLMTMNVSTFSLGLLLASSQNEEHRGAGWKRWLVVLRQPAIYAISSAWIVRTASLPIQQIGFIWQPLKYLEQGLIAIALITLGVQLSKTRPPRIESRIATGLAIRLLGGPVIAMVLTFVFGFRGETAQVLILGAASPTAINIALIAHEFKADSRFATAAVFYSTLLAVITITLLLLFLRLELLPWAR